MVFHLNVMINLVFRLEKDICKVLPYWHAKIVRLRHFYKNMDCDLLRPPTAVRGMKKLNKEAFRKTISIPVLKIPYEKIDIVKSKVKSKVLKMEKLRPIRPLALGDIGTDSNYREILLHPLAVNEVQSLLRQMFDEETRAEVFSYKPLELTYDNWNAENILKSILPEDKDALTSYSIIGHIIHVNLRDHLMDFKEIIGQVLLEKVHGCKCVVNKSQVIDNVYRNFELELLSGTPDYEVEIKENGVTFLLDFSKVYWNPRLSTEHSRIVDLLNTGDVLYDVFAGIGPFSIPASVKKNCTVLANDLNPESFKWLNASIAKNKRAKTIKTFNKDAKDFILEDIRTDLEKRWLSETVKTYNIHIAMNLPSLATEFLIYFKGLLAQSEDVTYKDEFKIFPTINVYTFAKGENAENTAKQNVENVLGPLTTLKGVYFVRNVAPNKDMFRVSFLLSNDILLAKTTKRCASDETKVLKKICIE